MNLADILIWTVLILFLVKGFFNGLMKEVCSLLGLLVGGWAAFRYDHSLAEAIRPLIHLPSGIAVFLSFMLIFLLLGMLFYLLGYLFTVVFKIMLLGWLNRAGGVLFGLLEGALILSMVLYFGTLRPVPEKVRAWIYRSGTARPFIDTGREIVSGWETRRVVSRPEGKRE